MRYLQLGNDQIAIGVHLLGADGNTLPIASGEIPVAFDDETITVSTVALGLDPDVYAPDGEDPATEATVVVSGQPIMLRDTGTEVTTTEGVPLAAGAVWLVEGAENIAQVRLIRTGGSDATVYVRYAR